MEEWPGADILLAISSSCENWCCSVWSEQHKSFPIYHEKAV